MEDNRPGTFKTDGAESHPRRKHKARPRARSVLVFVFLILGVASIASSIWTTRVPIRWNSSNPTFQVTALVSQTIPIGNDLRITLTRTVPKEGSYEAEALLEYKNEQTVPFTGVETYIIDFPKHDGYRIQLFKVTKELTTFLITKN